MTVQRDASEFLTFLLNQLHAGLKKIKQSKFLFANSFIDLIHDTFQGQVRIQTQTFISEKNALKTFDMDREIKTRTIPFLFLSLDLPPPPLFQDELEKNIIPQVSIETLLSKYDGVTGMVIKIRLINRKWVY